MILITFNSKPLKTDTSSQEVGIWMWQCTHTRTKEDTHITQGNSHVSKATAPTTLLSASWRSGEVANSCWSLSGGAWVPLSS